MDTQIGPELALDTEIDQWTVQIVRDFLVKRGAKTVNRDPVRRSPTGKGKIFISLSKSEFPLTVKSISKVMSHSISWLFAENIFE